jgi:O-antigen/teichoic acid export membrane protein
VQLITGTMFAAVYLLLQMQAGPYNNINIDYLASGCSFALLVFFLLCLVMKVCCARQLDPSKLVVDACPCLLLCMAGGYADGAESFAGRPVFGAEERL